MNIIVEIGEFLIREDMPHLGIFILWVIASFFIGRYIPSLLILVINRYFKRFFATQVIETYEQFIHSYRQRFQWAATLILILVFLGIVLPEESTRIIDFFNSIIEFIGRKNILFILCVIASFFIGRYTPELLKQAIKLKLATQFPTQIIDIYEKLINANQPLKWAGTSILILLSLNLIKDEWFYSFLHHIVDLSVIFSIALLVSFVSQQMIRTYGVILIRKLPYQADDLLLIFMFNNLVLVINTLRSAYNEGPRLLSNQT